MTLPAGMTWLVMPLTAPALSWLAGMPWLELGIIFALLLACLLMEEHMSFRPFPWMRWGWLCWLLPHRWRFVGNRPMDQCTETQCGLYQCTRCERLSIGAPR